MSENITAASWSLFLGQLGRGFVYAAIVCFVACAFLALFRRSGGRLAAVAFGLGSLSLAGVLGSLLTLFIRDQFQYEYVFAHGDAGTPLAYKIAGVWAGQQGSFLLWGLCSAIFGCLTMAGTGHYRRAYTFVFSTFLLAISSILAYETPFNFLDGVAIHDQVFLPSRGAGLNPTLQNYWIVIHPPTIFLGFGSLTVLFAYAVAAMVTGDLRDWVSRVRPWALASMAILGLGICMGGFWAYETLGWGGFWKWDPVENVSFVPWLILAAFIHGIIVQTTRSRWFGANLVLAGVPFLLFVYGTFLTRSGLLTDVSVHSFAKMDQNALKILLGFLVMSLVAFFGLYLFRGRRLAREAQADEPTPGINRESAYAFGTLLLCLLCLVISLGMSWPVVLSLMGRKMAVVEEPLYHQVVVWFFVPILLLMAVGPFISWRTLQPRQLWSRVSSALAVSVFLTGVAVFYFKHPQWGNTGSIPFPFGISMPRLPWMAYLTWVCLFTATANVMRAAELFKRAKPSLGAFVAHVGLAILMGGLILSRGFERVQENIIVLPGMPAKALDYTLSFDKVTGKDLYDRSGTAIFNMASTEDQFKATPGLFYQKNENGDDKGFTTPYIYRTLTHDIYLALHEPRVFVWDDPEWFKPGESKTINGVTAKYLKTTKQGESGKAGTKFIASVDVTVDGHTYHVNPSFQIGSGFNFEPVGDELAIVMPQMNVANRSVALQVVFAQPVYPLDLYYKPMTGLVWLGAGILFLGGMIAAIYRRPKRVKVPILERASDAPASEETKDAPVAVT